MTNSLDNLKEKASKIKFLILDVDGTMTDGGIYYLPDGSQMKRFYSHDGEGIIRLQEKGIPVGIISAARLTKPLIEARAKALGIQKVFVDRSDKLLVAQAWAQEMNLTPEQIAYMGDDIIDCTVMDWCGLAAAPDNAHQTAKNSANLITKRSGGYGAVREFIDFIMENV